jgi:hypothetical protein
VSAAAVLGPGLGGYILASHGLWGFFVIGEIVDLAAIGFFAFRCRSTYGRLVTFNATALRDRGDLPRGDEANARTKPTRSV